MYVLLGLRSARAPRSAYRSLARAPWFVIRKALHRPPTRQVRRGDVGAHGPRRARDEVTRVSASFKLLVTALALGTALAVGAHGRPGGTQSYAASAPKASTASTVVVAGNPRGLHVSGSATPRRPWPSCALPRRQSLRHGVRVHPGVGDLRRAERRTVGKGDRVVARQRCSPSVERAMLARDQRRQATVRGGALPEGDRPVRRPPESARDLRGALAHVGRPRHLRRDIPVRRARCRSLARVLGEPCEDVQAQPERDPGALGGDDRRRRTAS